MNHTKTIGLIICCLLASGTASAVTTQKAKSEKSSKTVHKTKTKRLKVNPITDEDDAWTANVETDIYRAGSFENIAIGYSASGGWDFNLSLVNAQVLGSNKYFQGDTFFSVAKTFELTNDLSVVVGSQNGLTMVNTKPRVLFNYNFLDTRYDVSPELSLHGGAYMANKALTGTVRRVGFLTGTEITFIPHQLALQMDYISGHQALSGATVNMLVNITTHSQVYFGVYVPEKNSGNEFSGIIGFNLSTKKL